MALSLSLPDTDSMTQWWTRFRFDTKRRIGFYRDMENAIRAGIPPYRAVERMCEVSRPRKSMRWLVNILEPALRSMEDGRSFASAFSDWVPSEDAGMLTAGEEMGNLPDAFKKLVELLENKRKIVSSLKSNLLPSGMLLVIASIMLAYITNSIGPQAKEMVPDHIMATLNILPHYIAFGEFLQSWGLVFVGGLLAASVIVWWSIPRWLPSPVRSWLDQNMPPWSFVARIQTVFFLISTSSMMQAGRTFVIAIDQLGRYSSPWVGGYLQQMRQTLRAGKSEVTAMQVKMLPQDVSDRLNFYAILPDFTQVMQETARDAMEKLIVVVERWGSVLRTIVLVVLALFILSTLSSMYDMSSGIERANEAFGG